MIPTLHFGKTIPTIRAALRYARQLHNIDAIGQEVSRPNLANWARDHAAVVADYFRQPGATMKVAVAHFGKSDTTIRAARALAQVGEITNKESERDSAA